MAKKGLAVLTAIFLLLAGFLVAKPVFAATSVTKYVTATTLNVRSGAGTNYKIIATLQKDQAVTVTQTKGSWDKITVGSITGWTSNQYLTTQKPVTITSTATTSTTMYVTASSLNVRSGPGTSYGVITTATKDQAVAVTQTSGTWSKITVNGITGWVSTQYLTTTKPASVSDIVTQVNALKTVGDSQQLILVTANGSATSNADIRTFEKDALGKWVPVLTTTGHIGKNGFTNDKQEGDGKSPTGKYTLGTAFGRYGNPGTLMPWRNITSDDVWVDDSTSPLYNTWQSKSATLGQWNSAENMNVATYNYGFVINYNTQSPIPYKGSAIFFHVDGTYGYTLGCTSTSQTNVINILKWLNPAKNPVIIQTPMAELGNY